MRIYRITCLTLAIALFFSFWPSPPALHAETLAVVDSSRDAASSLTTAEAKAPAEAAATTAISDLNIAVVFPDDELASISSITSTEMTVTVPTAASNGDVTAKMETGDSNGSPFEVGDSSTPDDTGIGTTWAITTSGTIVTDTTWSHDVLVTGDVTVNSGVTLTVEPGVTVFFAPHSDDQAGGRWSERAELIIWGTLMAEGAATTPIYFTSAATQTLPGDWGGIIIRKNSTQSSLKYGLIQYAETGVGFHISVEGGGTVAGTVANCTIQKSVYGIYVYGRPDVLSGFTTVTLVPTIKNSLIFSNTQGISLRVDAGYGIAENYATVQNNTIQNNEIGVRIRGNTWWRGQVDHYAEVVNNTFWDNTNYSLEIITAGNSDGSGADSDVRPTIENNLFDSVAVTTTPHIRLYMDPHYPNGIKILSPVIRYNTLRNSTTGILVEDELPYNTVEPTLSHNVFYGFDAGALALDNQTGRTITATHNYWGQTEAEWDAGAVPSLINGNVIVTDHLTSLSPPVVSRVTPGAAQPGDLMTIHGANFDVTPPVIWFQQDQLAYPGLIGAVEVTSTVAPLATDGDVMAEMYDGMSNGSPFEVGDSSAPDDTGIGTTWAITTSGTITTDTTWSQDVLVTGDVTVNSGVTLTVEPGVTVFFAANSDDQASGRWSERAELIIWGTLIAEGTSTMPIYFTSAATSALPGDWGGIIVRKDSTQSSLRYCLVQYAETGVSFYTHDEVGSGMLSGTVANCTLQHNVRGIHASPRPRYPDGGAITIDVTVANNRIVSNTWGLELSVSIGYKTGSIYAAVQNNTIQGNETGMRVRGNTWWIGHADLYPEIVNNTFRDNTVHSLEIMTAGSSDGSGADSDVRPTVENNLFDSVTVTTTPHIRLYMDPHHNDGVKILSPVIRYNTIRNSTIGILVEDELPYNTVEPTISHNVFYGFGSGALAVDNQTGRTITATQNYWGQTEAEWDTGAPSSLISGTVVVTDHLTSLSPPMVSRVTPGAAQPGDSMTIHGANFIDEAPPLAPTLVSLADGAVISNTTPTFDWEASPSPDVMGYQLDLGGAVIDVGAPTVYTTDILADGVYTWTVAAYDLAHNVGPYTDTWSFTLDATPPVVPTLVSPPDATFTKTNDLTLSWEVITDAAGYLLDVNGVISDVGDVTTYATGVLPEGVYSWAVAAYDHLHNVSAYADAWTFEVDATPPTIQAVSPFDGESDVLRTTPIVIDFDEGMDTSTVGVMITPAITGVVAAWSNGDARLTLDHDLFATDTHYTVDITGSDVAGNLLVAAPYTWAFTTGVASGVDLALDKALSGDITMEAGSSITYTLTVVNHGPTSPVTATITDTFSSAEALAAVSAPGCAWTPGSVTVTCTLTDVFTDTPQAITMVVTTSESYSGTLTNTATVASEGGVIDLNADNDDAGPVSIVLMLPATPDLVHPPDGTLTNTNQLTLTWNAVADAAGYLLDFNDTISDVGSVLTYTTQVLPEAVYTWTVAAYSGSGLTGAYADAWAFEIDATLPIVEATSPPDGATDVLRNVPLVVDFSESMLTDTVTVMIAPSVTGLVETWGAGDARLTLAHDELAANTTYTVTVTGSDRAGNQLAAPYVWTFITGAESASEADIALSKVREGTGVVMAGSSITYTLTVTNHGPTSPVTATITDNFSSAEALTAVSAPGCAWTTGSSTVTCTATNIISGTPLSITMVVTTSESYSGTLTNTAIVAPDGSVVDTNADNDEAGPVSVILQTGAGEESYIYLPLVLRNVGP